MSINRGFHHRRRHGERSKSLASSDDHVGTGALARPAERSWAASGVSTSERGELKGRARNLLLATIEQTRNWEAGYNENLVSGVPCFSVLLRACVVKKPTHPVMALGNLGRASATF